MFNEDGQGKPKTEPKSRLVGERTWICQETGEVRHAAEIEKQTCDGGFEKVWLATLLNALDLIGGKKFKVAEYLLKKRNRTNNMVIATQRKIAEDLEVGSQVVNETIKVLQKANFIQRVQPGVYIVAPGAIWRGQHGSRQAMMVYFNEIAEEDKE